MKWTSQIISTPKHLKKLHAFSITIHKKLKFYNLSNLKFFISNSDLQGFHFLYKLYLLFTGRATNYTLVAQPLAYNSVHHNTTSSVTLALVLVETSGTLSVLPSSAGCCGPFCHSHINTLHNQFLLPWPVTGCYGPFCDSLINVSSFYPGP